MPPLGHLGEYAIFFLLLILVLIAPYYRALYFPAERAPFFLLFSGVFLIFALVSAFCKGALTVPREFLIPCALLVCLYALNVPFAADSGLAYRAFLGYGVYFLLFFTVGSLQILPLEVVFFLFGVNVFVMSLLGYLEHFGFLPPRFSFLGMSLWELFLDGRLQSPFQYPNTASAYFGLGYIALLGVILKGTPKWANLLATFFAPLVLGGIFFTYSRGGVLALGWTLLLLLFLCVHRVRVSLFFRILSTTFPFVVFFPFLDRFLQSRLPLPFFFILLLGGIIAVCLQKPVQFLIERAQRFPSKNFLVILVLFLLFLAGVLFFLGERNLVPGLPGRLFDLNLRSHSVWERLVFYRDGFRVFLSRPFHGWGGGGWEILYPSVRSFPYFTRTTHNFYLGVLIEGGMVGFVLLLLLIFFLLRYAVAYPGQPWRAVFLALILLIFSHALMDFDFDLPAYQLTAWFLLGCMGFPSLVEKRKKLVLFRWVFVSVAGIFFVLSFLSFLAQREIYLGNRFLSRKRWNHATTHYHRAIRLEPWNGEYRYRLSLAFYRQFRDQKDPVFLEQSIQAGERALRFSPYRASLLLYLANLYTEEGDFEKALSFLERSIVQDPFEFKYYLRFAEIARGAGKHYLDRGMHEEALVYFDRALQLPLRMQEISQRSLRPVAWDMRALESILGEIQSLRKNLENFSLEE